MGKGLYNAEYEHDACGVGMVVNIHGNKSHELVDNALKVLENMRHRGAEGADNKTGDGAGIMLQIPHEFILLQGIPVPEKGKYGTGLVFLPKDEAQQQDILSIMIEEIEREGLSLMHLRNVPTNSGCLGETALATEPDIKQLFVTGVTDNRVPYFERTLYLIRKRIERRVTNNDFYICSLSSKNIIYKGMLSSLQLRQYFPDLTNNYFTSVHPLVGGGQHQVGRHDGGILHTGVPLPAGVGKGIVPVKGHHHAGGGAVAAGRGSVDLCQTLFRLDHIDPLLLQVLGRRRKAARFKDGVQLLGGNFTGAEPFAGITIFHNFMKFHSLDLPILDGFSVSRPAEKGQSCFAQIMF